MGRSSSKLSKAPNNPLEELQMKETKREQRKRQQERELKQIAKLQKKHANKHKHKRKQSKSSGKGVQKEGSFAKRASSTHRTSSLNSQSTSYEINKEEFNRQIEQRIQTHLDGDLCTFILNQISLTMQFLGNYESELSNVSEELLYRENELNQNLEEHSILLSTPLDAAAAKWVNYKPVHGVNKNNPQLLQPLAMYVVFENVDIARPNDANYDSISPLCKVDMDTDFYRSTPCKEDYTDMLREIKWKGYVRLKLREDPKSHRISGCEEVYTEGSSGYSTGSTNSIKYPYGSSNHYSSDTIYDYGYIAHLNTHHPLSELKMCSEREMCQLQAKVLPDSCVSTLAQFVPLCHDEDTDEGESESDESDDEDSDADADNHDDYTYRHKFRDNETMEAIRLYKLEQERRKLLLQQSFLNSKEFMRYFGELVRQHLAERLCITEEELDGATYRGSSIYTKSYELIPAIYVAHNAEHWPDCAFQFRIRERPLSTNPLTGQQFQWPTRSMVRRIETFGYHVIPIGYAPKRQRNPFREIEWRIVFPKAERYLEQHLTNTQVKVFMMTKALVKTFVEPQEQNKALMFTIDHLRAHLFWECERNFTAWPEEFLGEVLLRFISSFMQRLREKCLKDFFIEERNLFECIPEYSLATLYSILADIIANPLMHLMVALRNVDYAENFFPKLNFRKMFDNLREDNMLKLKMQAKNSRNMVAALNDDDEPESLLMPDEGAKGLVGMKQHREKTSGKLRRKTHLMRHSIQVKNMEEQEKRRFSVESIDVEFFFTKNLKNPLSKQINQGVENLRRTNILEIVLDHLLAMAERALQLRAIQLVKVYLAQAKRLCKFYHNYGCDMGAKEYLTTIDSIDEEVQALQLNDEFSMYPPALPIRTSVEPIKMQLANGFLEKLEAVRRTVRVDVERSMDAVAGSSRSVKLEANDSFTRGVKEAPGSCTSERLDKPTPVANRRKSIKFTEHVVEVYEGDTNPIQKPEGYNPIGILRHSDEKLDDKGITEEHKQSEEPNTNRMKDNRRKPDKDSLRKDCCINAIVAEEIVEKPKNNKERAERKTVEGSKKLGVKHTSTSEIQQITEEDISKIEDDASMKVNTSFTVSDAITAADPSAHVDFSDSDQSATAEDGQGDAPVAEKTKTTAQRFTAAFDLLKYTPLADKQIMKDIATSTEKIITKISSEEKRLQLRDMLRRKTVQIKGAFNQSSES